MDYFIIAITTIAGLAFHGWLIMRLAIQNTLLVRRLGAPRADRADATSSAPTAKALPTLLKVLKQKGYKVVHLEWEKAE